MSLEDFGPAGGGHALQVPRGPSGPNCCLLHHRKLGWMAVLSKLVKARGCEELWPNVIRCFVGVP